MGRRRRATVRRQTTEGYVTSAPRTAKQREKPERIANEIRDMIVSGALTDGEFLGHEPDLVKRFEVSRPSLREALRILETEGLITVVRGLRGGVYVHEPNERMTARPAAMVLRARNVPLADVFEARSLLEPVAAREVALLRSRRKAIRELHALIEREAETINDPEEFGLANAMFHARLVALSQNQTLSIVAEMLNEVVVRAVTTVSKVDDAGQSLSARRRGIRAQQRLVDLIDAGDGPAAEEFWRSHMRIIGRLMLGQEASTVVDLLDNY